MRDDEDGGSCIGPALLLLVQGILWLCIGLLVGRMLWGPMP